MLSGQRRNARYRDQVEPRVREAREAVRTLSGTLEEAKAALAQFVERGEAPEVAKQALERAGAPILALNVLEAATPGEPCQECGRKRYGERWANLKLAKVLKWVQPAVEVNVYMQNLCMELGFETVQELKAAAKAAKEASGIPEDDPRAAYRFCLEYCNEFRRGNGMADLIEPERVEEAG